MNRLTVHDPMALSGSCTGIHNLARLRGPDRRSPAYRAAPIAANREVAHDAIRNSGKAAQT
jgi:hypothetical protein